MALTDAHQERAVLVLWGQEKLLSLLPVDVPVVPSSGIGTHAERDKNSLRHTEIYANTHTPKGTSATLDAIS